MAIFSKLFCTIIKMNLAWDSLEIDPELKRIIKNEFKFDRMTAVQAASIPLFIKNKDLLVEAVTGSGKTLAFVVPILQILLKKSVQEPLGKFDIGSIVVSPTRELATQIYDVFKIFTDNLSKINFRLMLLIGGTSTSKDLETYKKHGANIVISTPGRLFDLLEKSDNFATKVRNCLEVFVLDEADQLLSLGFEKTLNDIIAFLPKLRRTSLFSATQTKDLDQIIRAGLRDPVNIGIKEKNAKQSSDRQLQMPERLANHYAVFDSFEDKLPFLVDFIRKHRQEKFLVFLSTCAQVDYFEKILNRFLGNGKILLLKLHRKLNKKRQKIFNQIRQNDHSLLLCTDVISRGVDIPRVDWVIHFDLPLTMENYVHRCGRSAHQIDTCGNSLLFCMNYETTFVETCQFRGIEITRFNKDGIQNHFESKLKQEIFEWIKSEAKRDINFYELSMQSYVSFIRTYSSKHIMARWLFKECDVVDVANGYGLLTMPKMPNDFRKAKKCKTQFRGTKEEAQIVKNFKNILYNRKSNKNNQNATHSDCATDDDSKNKFEGLKSTKFGFKRNPEIEQKILKRKSKGKIKHNFYEEMDLEELNSDARMVKKLKKSQISNKEFDDYFGL